MGAGQSLCLCPFSLGHARDKGLQKEYASNAISHRHDDRDLSLSETWCSKKERTQQAKQGKHSDSSPGSPGRHVGGWSGANCLVPGASRQKKWLELQTSLQKQDTLEGHQAHLRDTCTHKTSSTSFVLAKHQGLMQPVCIPAPSLKPGCTGTQEPQWPFPSEAPPRHS